MNENITPEVSVIMPVYNGARFIQAALESVRQQTYQSIEIIIIDDGSTDQTSDVVARFVSPFPIRYIRQKNQGQSAARNAGVLEAQSEFIAFLDVDDVWYPEKIATQVNLFQQHPEAGLVFSNAHRFKEGGQMMPDFFSTTNP